VTPQIAVNQIAIVIPVYNDWSAVRQLLPLIDRALPCQARVLLVDDASNEELEGAWPQDFASITDVSILHLRRNLGHQRAIAMGLVHVYQNWVDRNVLGVDAVVVIDGDGEDRPSDIPKLLEQFVAEGGSKVVFAARTRRLENVSFRFFYHAYRLLHKILTGVSVRVGNFSVLPPRALGRLMVVSELWKHYAAAVMRSRIPYTSVPIPRGPRLAGRSKMNFVGLLVHGLSAITMYGDEIGARLLALSAIAIFIAVALVGVVGGMHLFTGVAIPEWAIYVTGILLIIMAQALSASLALVYVIVSGRAELSFLPIRDAAYFIESVEQVSPEMV
jgi:polyisoprenyl-phosphate glycosyltransferase